MIFKRHTINKRVVQDLKKRSTMGILFYILLAIIVIFPEKFYERHFAFALTFLSSLLGVCLFRLVHLVISSKSEDRYETIHNNIFFVSVILTALIWGVALAYVTGLKGEYATRTLITVCVSGLCAGGVVAFVPYRNLSIFFNLAILMPSTVSMFVTQTHLYLASMFFLFSAYMVSISVRGNREYWDALENEHLLEIKSQELARLSNTDPMTGLYNRRYFDAVMEKEWKRSWRTGGLLSVILLDIDHFKNINDTFGHQVGDEYLKRLAFVLSSVFRRDYDVIARYGGEEFIVLLPDVNADAARQLAQKVKQNIEQMIFDHEGKKVATTISAGVICLAPDFGKSAGAMIDGADKALYQAKQSGRNRVIVFDDQMTAAD